MTQFSSGKFEKLTADPRPWANDDLDGRAHRFATHLWDEDYWHPRPEFDRPLTNPANPILAEFRAAVTAGDPYATPADWLANLDAMDPESDAWHWRGTPYLDHAERVLTRLAALTPKEHA